MLVLSNFQKLFCDKKSLVFLVYSGLSGCQSDAPVANDVLTAGGGMTNSVNNSTDNGVVDCEQIWQKNNVGFYENNPTYIDSVDHSTDWHFSTPEAQGMDSSALNSGLTEWNSHSTLLNVTIIRNNHIVTERFYNGSEVNHANNIHSSSKSMLLAMLGYAVEQGHINSLDDAVSDYLPNYRFLGIKADLTIRHLMNMSSGWDWVEDSTEYQIENESDWVKAIVDRDMINVPGSVFNYSSGNTHVLSAVLTNATGQSTCEYAHENLFEPLGIMAEHWGRDPQGIYSGGYNLYMTPREMAKYARFILDIIKDGEPGTTGFKKIIKDSIAPQFMVDAEFQYGELWWLRNIAGYDMNFGWGYGGQFMYIIPDLNIIMIITQDTSGTVRVVDHGAFIENYLIPAVLAVP